MSLDRARELILSDDYAIVLGPRWEEVNRHGVIAVLEREGVEHPEAVAEQALLEIGGKIERLPKMFEEGEFWVRWLKRVG